MCENITRRRWEKLKECIKCLLQRIYDRSVPTRDHMKWVLKFERWLMELSYVHSIGWRGVGKTMVGSMYFLRGHRKVKHMKPLVGNEE